MKPLADYNPNYSWPPQDNRPWIERERGVTAEERRLYDLLYDRMWNLSPPYLLEIVREMIAALDEVRSW